MVQGASLSWRGRGGSTLAPRRSWRSVARSGAVQGGHQAPHQGAGLAGLQAGQEGLDSRPVPRIHGAQDLLPHPAAALQEQRHLCGRCGCWRVGCRRAMGCGR